MRLPSASVYSTAALCGVLTVTSSAFTPQSQPIRTTTVAVLMDVSVVDRKGNPVTDLKLEDFELREDGVRQAITSARFVSAGPAATSRPTGTSPSARAFQSPPSQSDRPAARTDGIEASITAILFDRLSLDARAAARRAALTYVDGLLPESDYAGVFMADLSLVTFAPFTNDVARLKASVDRMAGTAPANLKPETPDPRIAGRLPETSPTAGAESVQGYAGVARDGGTKGEPRAAGLNSLEQMLLSMETSYRQMLAESEGHASISALTATVSALSSLTGRKTVLYFSEALPVTDRIQPLLDKVIAAANRSNVTIHTVDAAGLRVHSEEAAANRALGVAGAQGVGDAAREKGAWTKEMELQEQVVSSRASAVLGRLAKETGGSFVTSTNDLAAGVARMHIDRRSYYLLGYQPTNGKLDGRYRRVSVKVKRSATTVRMRPGYSPPVAPSR